MTADERTCEGEVSMTEVMGRPAARPVPHDLEAKYREPEGQFFFTGVGILNWR